MSIKIINLNLWYGGLLFNKVIKFLEKEDADILCLQEVYHNPHLKGRFNTVFEFKKLLGYPYFAFAPTFTHTTKTEGQLILGNAIFSKFPIIEDNSYFYIGSFSETVLEDPKLSPFIPRSLQYVKINFQNYFLNVFNTQGIWGKNGNDNQSRLDMSRKIVGHLKNRSNVILCGDFNVNEGTQTINNIEKYLTNVFKGERETSFNIKRKPINSDYKTAVVDFIFTSKNLKVLGHSVPKVDISDHLPLKLLLDL